MCYWNEGFEPEVGEDKNVACVTEDKVHMLSICFTAMPNWSTQSWHYNVRTINISKDKHHNSLLARIFTHHCYTAAAVQYLEWWHIM